MAFSTQGARSISPFGKTAIAQKKGAAALLIIAGGFPRRSFSNTGSWILNSYRSAQNPLTFTVSENVVAGILGEDGKGIIEKMKINSLPSKTYKANIDFSFLKETKTTYAANVMGLLEGTDKKDEYVIITAHYDHVGTRNDTTVYYGADDDGSGTVSVLELAEAFAKAKAAGKGPRRSILFMTVSGEEHGLWGSAYYANNPVYPLDKTTVDLNIDMIGRTGNEYEKDKDSANYVYIIGDDKLSSDLAPITDMANNANTKLKLDRKYNDPNDPNRFYYRSDHYNFAEKGVPIIFYFNGVHKDYHRPTDTPDKINYPMMAKRGQLVFYTAWEMANREQMMKRDLKLEVPPRGF
jgi:Zn-dependent M28 family amino/carboxypeptidase